MNDDIRKKLEEEIERGLDELTHYVPGSETKTAAIEDLAKLYRLKLDEEKKDLEIFVAEQNRQQEKKSEEDLKFERYFKIGLDLANLILPLGFYWIWMKRGFKFEEKGTFGSNTFRELFRWFRPTR